MRASFVWFALLAVGSASSICGCEISPTNAFDPDTPPASQARGTIRGTVLAVRGPTPDGVVPEAALCDDSLVDVVAGPHDGFAVVLRALVADEEGAALRSETQPTNASGGFAFQNIIPGRYSLEVFQDGFLVPAPRELTVVPGGGPPPLTLCARNATPPRRPTLAPLPALVGKDAPALSVVVLDPEDGITYRVTEEADGLPAPAPVLLPADLTDDDDPYSAPLTLGADAATRVVWRVAVTAVDALGNEAAPVVATIVQDGSAPAPPENLRASAGRDRILLAWDPVPGDSSDDGAATTRISYGVVPKPFDAAAPCPYGDASALEPAQFAVEGQSPITALSTTATLSGIPPGTDVFLYAASVDLAGNAGCYGAPVRVRPDVVGLVPAPALDVELPLQSAARAHANDGVRATAHGAGGFVVVDRTGAVTALSDAPAFDVAIAGDHVFAAAGALGIRVLDLDEDGAPVAASSRFLAAGTDVQRVAPRFSSVLGAGAAGLVHAPLDESGGPATAVAACGAGGVLDVLVSGRLRVQVCAEPLALQVVRAGVVVGTMALSDAPAALAVVDDVLLIGRGGGVLESRALAPCGAGPAGCVALLARQALPGGDVVLDLKAFDDLAIVAADSGDAGALLAVDPRTLRVVGRQELAQSGPVVALGPVVCGAANSFRCHEAVVFPLIDAAVRTTGVVARRADAENGRGCLIDDVDDQTSALVQTRLQSGAVVSTTPLASRGLDVAALADRGCFALDDQGALTFLPLHAPPVALLSLGDDVSALIPALGGPGDAGFSAYTGNLVAHGSALFVSLTRSQSGLSPAGLVRVDIAEDAAGAVTAAVTDAVALPPARFLTSLSVRGGHAVVTTEPFGVVLATTAAPLSVTDLGVTPDGGADSVTADVVFLDDGTALVGGVRADGTEGFFALATASGGATVTGVPADPVGALQSLVRVGRHVVVAAQDGTFVMAAAEGDVLSLQSVLRIPDAIAVQEPVATHRGVFIADDLAGAVWVVLR